MLPFRKSKIRLFMLFMGLLLSLNLLFSLPAYAGDVLEDLIYNDNGNDKFYNFFGENSIFFEVINGGLTIIGLNEYYLFNVEKEMPDLESYIDNIMTNEYGLITFNNDLGNREILCSSVHSTDLILNGVIKNVIFENGDYYLEIYINKNNIDLYYPDKPISPIKYYLFSTVNEKQSITKKLNYFLKNKKVIFIERGSFTGDPTTPDGPCENCLYIYDYNGIKILN